MKNENKKIQKQKNLLNRVHENMNTGTIVMKSKKDYDRKREKSSLRKEVSKYVY